MAAVTTGVTRGSGCRAWGLVAILSPVLLVSLPVVCAAEVAGVRAALVTDAGALVPARPLRLGVLFTMADGWHLYWRNSGDAGLPPEIRWELPDGFVIGDLQWPAPERFSGPPVVGYGYGKEVLLSVSVTTPATLAGDAVTLGAQVDWLACHDASVPGSGDLRIALPVAPAAHCDAAGRPDLFDRFALRLPTLPDGWQTSVAVGPQGFTLAIVPAAGAVPGGSTVLFFPDEPGMIADDVQAQTEDGVVRLRIGVPVTVGSQRSLTRLSGVLSVTPADRNVLRMPAAYHVSASIPVGDAGASLPGDPNPRSPDP